MPPSNSPSMDRRYRAVRYESVDDSDDTDSAENLFSKMKLDSSGTSIDDVTNQLKEHLNIDGLDDKRVRDIAQLLMRTTIGHKRSGSKDSSPTLSERSKENLAARTETSKAQARESPLRGLLRKASGLRSRSRTPSKSQKASPLRARRSPSPFRREGVPPRARTPAAAPESDIGSPPSPTETVHTLSENTLSDTPLTLNTPGMTNTPGLGETPVSAAPMNEAEKSATASGPYKISRKTATPSVVQQPLFNPTISPQFNVVFSGGGKASKKAKGGPRGGARRLRRDPPAPQARAPQSQFAQAGFSVNFVTQPAQQPQPAPPPFAGPPASHIQPPASQPSQVPNPLFTDAQSPITNFDLQQATNPTTPYSAMSIDQNISFTIGSKNLSTKTRSRRTLRNGKLTSPRGRAGTTPFPQPSFSPETEAVANNFHEDEETKLDVDYSGHKAMIEDLRVNARAQYASGEYRLSAISYTNALMAYNRTTTLGMTSPDDLRAILLANRAAAMLMLGCYEASAVDCAEAVKYASPLEPDANGNYLLSAEGGVILKAKVYTRMGRSLAKMGKLDEATIAFNAAIEIAETAVGTIPVFDAHDTSIAQLNQVRVDADTGRTEVNQCQDCVYVIKECGIQKPEDAHTVPRRMNLRALSQINIALGLAPANIELWHLKLAMLAALNRWRELHICCEKLACQTTKWDGVFVQDLETRNPLPKVPEAKYIAIDTFDKDENAVKLTSKAVTEVILRLPCRLQAMYVRALRLEERCHPALTATSVLNDFVDQYVPVLERIRYTWISIEQSKLERTTKAKETGDTRFRTADYKGAVDGYTACMRIDSEDRPGEVEGSAGGRLHAVLHCNRAAAHMAMSNYREAISDSNAALRIHGHYMKAMLRKSRSFVRLHRFEEAQTEYERYIGLVEQARAAGGTSSTFTNMPCNFDGPVDVTDVELDKVRQEFLEVKRSKINAEHAARTEEAERKNRQKWYNEAFNQSRHQTAEERRQEWYNQQGQSSRRWDSFNGRGPNRSSRTQQQEAPRQERPNGSSRFGRAQQERPAGSPGSDSSVCHYTILEISRDASEAEIKKGYKRAALKFHPDKNQAEGAADMFRRVKLAYDVLKDEDQRRAYDKELRWSRRFG